jgi:hypothetical protein
MRFVCQQSATLRAGESAVEMAALDSERAQVLPDDAERYYADPPPISAFVATLPFRFP